MCKNKTEKIFSPSLPRRTDKTEKEIILVMTTNFLNWKNLNKHLKDLPIWLKSKKYRIQEFDENHKKCKIQEQRKYAKDLLNSKQQWLKKIFQSDYQLKQNTWILFIFILDKF